MNKITLATAILAMASTTVLCSCDKDNEPTEVGGGTVTPPGGDPSDDPTPVPDDIVFTDATGLKLTYSGEPMLGKTAAVAYSTASTAVITLSSTIDLSQIDLSDLPVQGIELPATMEGPGVIPGSATTELSVTFDATGAFSGESANEYCTYNYNGQLADGTLSLNIENLELTNQAICGTWSPDVFNQDPFSYTIETNPIHIVWDHEQPFDFMGTPLPIPVLLSMFIGMPAINNEYSIPEALTHYLQSVTFRPDAAIWARYLDDESGNAQSSPLNMLHYVLEDNGNMRLFINPNAIADAADAEDTPRSRAGQPAVDLNNIIGNLLSQLLPMLPGGVPMHYAIGADGKLSVYLGTEVLLPLLEQNVVPLLQDPAFVAQIADLLSQDPSLGFIGSLLPDMAASLVGVIHSTTKLELGVCLVPSSLDI